MGVHSLRMKKMASNFLLVNPGAGKAINAHKHIATSALYQEILGSKSVRGIRYFIPTTEPSHS